MLRFGVVVRDPLPMRFIQTKGEVHLHVRTCVLFTRISGTAGRIALDFAMWLRGPTSCVLDKEWIVYLGIPAREHVHKPFRIQGRAGLDCVENWCAIACLF